VIFIDALMVKICDRRVANRPVCRDRATQRAARMLAKAAGRLDHRRPAEVDELCEHILDNLGTQPK